MVFSPERRQTPSHNPCTLNATERDVAWENTIATDGGRRQAPRLHARQNGIPPGAGDCVAERWGTNRRGPAWAQFPPTPVCYLVDTDMLRASERRHPGQGTGGVGDLDRPGLVSARSKCVANYVRSARIGDTGSTFMNKIDDEFTGGLNDG